MVESTNGCIQAGCKSKCTGTCWGSSVSKRGWVINLAYLNGRIFHPLEEVSKIWMVHTIIVMTLIFDSDFLKTYNRVLGATYATNDKNARQKCVADGSLMKAAEQVDFCDRRHNGRKVDHSEGVGQQGATRGEHRVLLDQDARSPDYDSFVSVHTGGISKSRFLIVGRQGVTNEKAMTG